MSRRVTVLVTQMACTNGPKKNLDKAEILVRKAAASGAQIILLQELFKWTYFCKDQNSNFFNGLMMPKRTY